jgi:hypothetical protein
MRGFSQRWIEWIQRLTNSTKIAILLNGISGPWINIKRGLRQGDPLSPFVIASSGCASTNY